MTVQLTRSGDIIVTRRVIHILFASQWTISSKWLRKIRITSTYRVAIYADSLLARKAVSCPLMRYENVWFIVKDRHWHITEVWWVAYPTKRRIPILKFFTSAKEVFLIS